MCYSQAEPLHDSRNVQIHDLQKHYRYIDVLSKFVIGYNDTVHSATAMAPSKVIDSVLLAKWNKMRARHSSIRRAPVRFSLGKHVRISKETLKFAKGGEQNYTTEISRIQKFVCKNSSTSIRVLAILRGGTESLERHGVYDPRYR
jgi:hypothetical protein